MAGARGAGWWCEGLKWRGSTDAGYSRDILCSELELPTRKLIEEGQEHVAADGEPLARSDVAFLGQAPVGGEVDQAPVVGMRVVGEEGDEGSPLERRPGVFVCRFAAEAGDGEEVDGVVCGTRLDEATNLTTVFTLEYPLTSSNETSP